MSLFTGASALAGAGLSGLFRLGAASKSANASEQAAAAQAKTAQEALDFTKQKQAEQLAQAQPYLQVGQQAVAALPGMARQAPGYGPPMPYTTQPVATRPMQGAYPTTLSGMNRPVQMGPMQTQTPTQNGGMVLLQAPDGSQKQVPQEQAQFYISKGAKRVS